MIDHLWLVNLLAWGLQVAVITAVAAAGLAALRISAPTIRYHWWRVMLVICLALPALQPWRTPVASAGGVAELIDLAPLLVDAGSSFPSRPDLRPASPDLAAVGEFWPAAIVLLLIAGAAVRFVWLGAGLIRLRRLRGAGERAEQSDGHAELQKLIDAGAEIRYVKVLGQPVTFGLRRPIVLLPVSLRSLPEPVQRAVLAHELWHVQRRDWGWILAEECVRAVFWFHPAISFLVSRVQLSREEVVDELTVLLTNSRRSYLEALLAFADEPPLFAAAPFVTRRHLFQRMMRISKEAVMSSRRIIASSAAMAATVFLAGWSGAAAFPLTGSPVVDSAAAAAQAQQPARDHRPGEARPASEREQELQAFLQREPTGPTSKSAYLEVARLQQTRDALGEAETTLQAALTAFPDDAQVLSGLAQFYVKTGQFDRAMVVVENAAAVDPTPGNHLRVAQFYQEKVQKDRALAPVEKLTYIRKGIEATDRALALDPYDRNSMIYKNILLRHQASIEPDPSRGALLLAEADGLRKRALELAKAAGASVAGPAVPAGYPPPPPPPPPPSQVPALVNGKAPVRVSVEAQPPVKLHDVRPEYPPLAKAARVNGVVGLVVTLDETGAVHDARVVRSIPMLDEAALAAVKQWRYAPTLVNGVPTPVVMTVAVEFRPEG